MASSSGNDNSDGKENNDESMMFIFEDMSPILIIDDIIIINNDDNNPTGPAPLQAPLPSLSPVNMELPPLQVPLPSLVEMGPPLALLPPTVDIEQPLLQVPLLFSSPMEMGPPLAQIPPPTSPVMELVPPLLPHVIPPPLPPVGMGLPPTLEVPPPNPPLVQLVFPPPSRQLPPPSLPTGSRPEDKDNRGGAHTGESSKRRRVGGGNDNNKNRGRGIIIQERRDERIVLNKRVTWSVCLDIGQKQELEDRIRVIPDFMTLSCRKFGNCNSPRYHGRHDSKIHYFGVFDGHGGSQVSDYCANNLHELIAAEWRRENLGRLSKSKIWESIFWRAFRRADNNVKNYPASQKTGSTALVALLSACQIITAHSGDSRAILCRGDKVIPLTVDHKLNRPDEVKRIKNGGGILLDWLTTRMQGVLSVTRSIGDHYFKPWLTSDPELSWFPRSQQDECLILASHGLWEKLSTNEVGRMACRHIIQKRQETIMKMPSFSGASVASCLLQAARIRGSMDDISIIVIDLKGHIY